MEKFFIKHMGKIIFGLGIIIFLTWLIPLINLPTWGIVKIVFGIDQLNQIISTQYMFTTIGAIFAFWYGYKKYERDKELDLIEKYSKEYENIKNTLNNGENSNEYYKLINLFYKEYHLYTRGYISTELWEDWEYWIKNDISYLLSFDIEKLKKDASILPISIDIFSSYKIKESRSKNNTFLNFIRKILNIILNELENTEIFDDKKKEEFRILKIEIIKESIEQLNK